ncbi:MAG TPA: nitronate monooxygenase, partial [Bacteroidota bacterium]
AGDNSTILTLRKVTPVRMIKSPFALKAQETETRGATKEELIALLGSKREQKGIFEGNWEEGEFEAGQSSGLIHEILPAKEVIRNTMREFGDSLERLRRILGQDKEG